MNTLQNSNPLKTTVFVVIMLLTIIRYFPWPKLGLLGNLWRSSLIYCVKSAQWKIPTYQNFFPISIDMNL